MYPRTLCFPAAIVVKQLRLASLGDALLGPTVCPVFGSDYTMNVCR